MLACLRIGQRVSVPFGRKGSLAPAYVVGIERGEWTSTLKPIAEILDPAGQLSDHLLELGKWISQYYCCPLGRCLAAMIPQAVRKQSGFTTVRQITLTASESDLTGIRLGKKQKGIIEALQETDGSLEANKLLESAGASRSTLRSLIDKGWIEETVTKEPPKPAGNEFPREDPDFDINEDQQKALKRISEVLSAGEFTALLLYGKSGSGKTEVYVRAMREVLAAGKQAIMLVPEIALTTQLMKRLACRFDNVAVIHSGLSSVQRSLAWEEIRTGRTPVIIGTRSAVFAPCPNPGIIVVDEEQEPSYKNLQSPRFHVRDVAIKRAQVLGIPIILGSATPSLETWYNESRFETYERIDLPHRVRSLPMPTVSLVDMRNEPSVAAGASLSRRLRSAIRETLERQEQIVLMLNRRGYATWLFCPQCKMRIQCPRCNANMVLHLSQNRIQCHQCNSSEPIPQKCPDLSCRGKLVHGGGGTERIEEQLRIEFPEARVHRADSDTMTHARKYRELVRAFEQRELDILLGTQMIAKGLDFPNVSLVGVIGAEPPASMSDFRSNERLFQLVTQVAGRAGRADVPGQVVVQSLATDSAALRHAMHHDFDSFAASEMPRRQAMGLPPYTRITRFVLSGPREGEINEEGKALVTRLRDTIAECDLPGCTVLGPHPCVIERVRNMYRAEVLLKVPSAGQMLQILNNARHKGKLRTKAKAFIVDVDPVSLT